MPQIEEKINIDTLELLKQAFQEADEDGSGELDLDEFKILLKSKLNLSGTKVRVVSPVLSSKCYKLLDKEV